jgi:hypothetical protein
MFNNTMTALINPATNVDLALIDGPTARKTLRASADGALRLSIAHTETKENGAYPTQRSVVRLEKTFQVSESSDVVVGYVQFIMSVPKTVVTSLNATELAAMLVNFLIKSGEDATAGSDDIETADLLAVPRLFAGEP